MDTIARELPIGWAWADLETLASKQGVISDGDWVESKDQNPEGSVRLIQLADVGELKFVDKSKRFMDLDRATEMNCLFLMEGDLLIARLGDPVGKACLLPKLSQKCVTAVDVMVFRPENLNAVDKNYIAYVINSPRLRNKINLQLSGTTRKRITGKKLKVTKFPFPPLDEQERIVDKVDELFSAIEAGERAIEQARAGVASYRKAILKAAVTGELTRDWRDENSTEESAEALLERILTARYEAWEKSELEKLDAKGKARPETERQWEKFRARYKAPVEPETEELPDLPSGWAWVSQDMILSSLITGPFGSMLHQADYVETGIPLVNPISIVSGKIVKDKLKHIDSETLNRLERFKLAEGDVVIARRGDMGRCASVLNEHDGWLCGTGSMILRPSSLVVAEYLSQSLQYGHAKAFLEANAIGTTMKNLNRTVLKSVPIAISSLEEQKEILSKINEALSKADAVEATLNAQSRQAKALKQAVLKTAFEGKLVPQNPNDEPASQLLKRIKAAS